ncbi:MAG: MopE-related protein [bacterium]
MADEVAERCNGIDDDCDGTLDERTEIACHTYADASVNVGICREGLAWCSASEGAGMEQRRACEEEISPQEETCNAQDDDCDTRVDERPEGGPLERRCFPSYPGFDSARPGNGPCRRGTETCGGGAWGPVSAPRARLRDVCNGSTTTATAARTRRGGSVIPARWGWAPACAAPPSSASPTAPATAALSPAARP